MYIYIYTYVQVIFRYTHISYMCIYHRGKKSGPAGWILCSSIQQGFQLTTVDF